MPPRMGLRLVSSSGMTAGRCFLFLVCGPRPRCESLLERIQSLLSVRPSVVRPATGVAPVDVPAGRGLKGGRGVKGRAPTPAPPGVAGAGIKGRGVQGML